ncbi:hypothetical protein TNCV_4366251 [Trichonephila clavipes]|nr:hypothetical protein TNCV_4366251 [Trichonephila clavipes]
MSTCGRDQENTILLLCAAKVRLLKLQEAYPERDADQSNPTRVQKAMYPDNKQAKEEIASAGLSRSLEQSFNM